LTAADFLPVAPLLLVLPKTPTEPVMAGAGNAALSEERRSVRFLSAERPP
jgi:hypothetical protein